MFGQLAHEKSIPIAFLVSRETSRYLKGDPLRLGQILINLVGNALKFTEKGEVVLQVTTEGLAGDGERLTFSVHDTGIGMTPEQVSNLFQPFNQADTSTTRTYGGTGLGLSISKQLCELMGGRLLVESEPGKGSTFIFRVNFGVVIDDLRGLVDDPVSDLCQKSVLVVDDNENARDVLVAMLCANGLIARAVSSGEEALLALADSSDAGEPFDLVLMDWRMPGVNGIETSHQIKSHLQLLRIPEILMISAFERDEVTNGVANPEFDGFLVKPVKETLLIDTIVRIFAKKAAASSSKTPPTLLQNFADLIGRRVLLVDDNEINCDLATELLGDLGILVTVAVNGRKGIERVAAESFDLVLMDIQMPVMDGLTATRQIRADGRRLPIIAMTAHALSGDRKRSLDAGMNDHLTKPISPDKLKEMLFRWMPEKPAADQEPEVAPRKQILPQNGIPDQLPPFDIKAALARTNGKPKLLRKMMLSFGDKYANAASDLRGLIVEGRAEEAETIAHSLKSAAATLEARDLTQTASAVEQAFRFGRTENLDLLIDAMERALSPAIAAVSSLDAKITVSLSPSNPDVAPFAPVKPRPRILVVDDESSNFELLTDMFGGEFEVLFATTGVAALDLAATKLPDVILLDVMMPGIDGFEVCKRLKAVRPTHDIPVIFMTGLGDAAAETKGFEVGAADYVSKPINPATFRARINNQISLKLTQDRLIVMSMTDDLTGLANRRRFDEMSAYEYARHERSGTYLSLILLDVDYFKAFNDTYGHVAGDDCLRRVAQAINAVIVRATDLVARYGGEEFVFLLPETSLQGAMLLAEKLRKSVSDLATPHCRSSAAGHVTVSLGVISARCLRGSSKLNILAQVDEQLYAAKAGGRNRICGANAA